MLEARKFGVPDTLLALGLGLFVPTATHTAEGSAALALPESDLPAMLESRWISGATPITSWPASDRARCSGENPPCADSIPLFKLTLNAGSYPLDRGYPLGERFEVFRSGWESHRVSAELGDVWTRLPPMFKLELEHSFSAWAHLYFAVGLRRDLSAWQADPLAGNWVLSDKDLDLNQPMAGYFHAENSWGSFILGRFPVHWSPSPEYGLTLSRAVPYHNGAMTTLRLGHARYLLLFSSLNPWLQGTPLGDSSSSDYPVGSEEWLQRHYRESSVELAHSRIYDARVKTLIAHRLEGNFGPLAAGMTEMNVIGGKIPDFADLNPFAVYHNDFKEGYASMAVSMDAKVRLPFGFAALGELFLDDVRFSETEGESSPTIIGLMGGLEQAWKHAAFTLLQSVHVIRTDPLMYRHPLPYGTLSSRIILSSNNQDVNDSPFVDKYVVDYPLGYARGGGVLDTRYAARLFSGPNRGLLRLEYLTSEGASLRIPYDSLANGAANPSPDRKEEWKAILSASRELGHGLALQGGIGLEYVIFPARAPRSTASHFQAGLGASWTWP